MTKSRFCYWITVMIYVFLYFPILLLVINSFNASRFGGVWGGFSLKWYGRLFRERQLWEAVANSLIVAFFSTIASAILGGCAAFSLYRYKSPIQKVHYGLIYAPLAMPDILMGISLLLFFFFLQIDLSLFTIIIAHTTFCTSYVTLVLLSKLENFDNTLVEAGLDLGASRLEVMRRIVIPLMAPGFFAAALLAFTLSIDDFVITFFVAGEGSTTLPIYIYSMIKYGATPVINALSTLILVATLITILLMVKMTKDVSS